VKEVIGYSEAFKKHVVDEIARGKFSSAYKAQNAYGIRGSMTVTKWLKKYGREDLLPKRVRIETMEEIDHLKAARKRIRELEAALADAHIDNCLGDSFLEIACEWMKTTPEEFKKKHALTLSDVRKTRGLR
jgi:transposase-like protein